jgi:RNA polymerase sigma factor (TIGR02999 family)
VSDPAALNRLLPEVYDELKRLAALAMRDQRKDHTLQPTALVHEVYLKLADSSATPVDRTHLLATAARAMRQILVDHARARVADKRGGGAFRVTLSRAGAVEARQFDLLAFDEALNRLEALDAQQARIVELRYVVGLSVEEVGEAIGVSPRTVKRDAAMAKAWLFRELSAKPGP